MNNPREGESIRFDYICISVAFWFLIACTLVVSVGEILR